MTYAVQPKTKMAHPAARQTPITGTPKHSRTVTNETIELTLQSSWQDAISLHESCAGVFADAHPQVSISYDGSGSHALHLSLDAEVATHLIAQGPNGRWLCDADALDGQPWVVFPAASSGVYTVWTAAPQPSHNAEVSLRVGTTPPPNANPIDRARTRVLRICP